VNTSRVLAGSLADSILFRGCKNCIRVVCFLPDEPTLGVFGTALTSRGVIFTELRKPGYSLVDRGCFPPIEIVRLRAFDLILRDSSFPVILNFPPLDFGEYEDNAPAVSLLTAIAALRVFPNVLLLIAVSDLLFLDSSLGLFSRSLSWVLSMKTILSFSNTNTSLVVRQKSNATGLFSTLR
jgi:hypothetical protein